MANLFLTVLNLSLQASILVLVVLVLRLFLKQAPKWIGVLLWGIVALRLLCPFTLESPVSLMPQTDVLLTEWTDDYVGDVQIIHENTDGYDRAIDAGRIPIAIEEGDSYVVTAPDMVRAPATVETALIPILSVVWLAGVAGIAACALVSTLRLRRSVNTAVKLRNNIYQSEFIDSPFVLGIFAPKVYIPYGVEPRHMGHVIAHEQTHIRRRDHIWKALGFLLLTVHWFNPLLWLAYSLFCRDLELACDEAVIRSMDNHDRADYAQALLICSVRHKGVIACPVAFGEVGVKARVESVAAYRKPAFWVILLSMLVCLATAVCFLTAPASEAKEEVSDAKQTLTEVSRYIELAAHEHSFENMDEATVNALLSEYGPLTEGFELLARQTADGKTKYILGAWDVTKGPNPLADMHTMWHSPARSDEEFEVIYHRDDSEAVDLALMNGETPENAYIIENSWMHNTDRHNLFLIVPNDNTLSLWDAMYIYLYNPNGRAYIEGAAERSVAITDISTPYLEIYLISPEYGEITEKINLTPQEAEEILNEEKIALDDGYGLAATLHWNDSVHYTKNTGIPATILKYAVENCGYTFLRPADITGDIVEARLDCDWLEEPRIADAADLPRLREILTNAEFGFVGACGYGAKLTVTCSDGTEHILFKGTDGCDTMVFGSFGGYFIGDAENTEFWAMFGLDLETKQPIA